MSHMCETIEVNDIIRKVYGKKIIRDRKKGFYEVPVYIDQGTIMREQDAEYIGKSLKL